MKTTWEDRLQWLERAIDHSLIKADLAGKELLEVLPELLEAVQCELVTRGRICDGCESIFRLRAALGEPYVTPTE